MRIPVMMPLHRAREYSVMVGAAMVLVAGDVTAARAEQKGGGDEEEEERAQHFQRPGEKKNELNHLRRFLCLPPWSQC